jgi:hypothetical protein
MTSEYGIGGSVIIGKDSLIRIISAENRIYSFDNLSRFSSDSLREDTFDEKFFQNFQKLIPVTFIFPMIDFEYSLRAFNHFPLNTTHESYFIDCCQLDTNKYLIILLHIHEEDNGFAKAWQVNYYFVDKHGKCSKNPLVAYHLKNNHFEARLNSRISRNRRTVKIIKMSKEIL